MDIEVTCHMLWATQTAGASRKRRRFCFIFLGISYQSMWKTSRISLDCGLLSGLEAMISFI